MTTENSVKSITVEAGADLSTKQYYFMAVAADGQVDPAGDGAYAEGVLQNNPAAAGRAATVAISGVTKVVASGVIAAGGDVSSDTNGKATASATGDIILGTAMSAAAADGDIISVLFHPRGTAV